MPQRPIELILAKQLASSLSVPILLVDSKGDLLYLNEPAEEIFGRRFDEIDSLPLDERMTILAPRDVEGRRLTPESLPTMVAMREQRPIHGEFWINGLDGRPRATESTVIPLQGVDDTVVGAVILMWLRAVAGPEALRPAGSIPVAVPLAPATGER